MFDPRNKVDRQMTDQQVISAMSKINAFVRNIQGTLGNHQEKRTIDYVQRDKDNLSEDEIQEAKSTMRHAHQ